MSTSRPLPLFTVLVLVIVLAVPASAARCRNVCCSTYPSRASCTVFSRRGRVRTTCRSFRGCRCTRRLCLRSTSANVPCIRWRRTGSVCKQVFACARCGKRKVGRKCWTTSNGRNTLDVCKSPNGEVTPVPSMVPTPACSKTCGPNELLDATCTCVPTSVTPEVSMTASVSPSVSVSVSAVVTPPSMVPTPACSKTCGPSELLDATCTCVPTSVTPEVSMTASASPSASVSVSAVCSLTCSLYERLDSTLCQCVSLTVCDTRQRKRREYREVPASEREAFVRAVKQLNEEGIWGTIAALHAADFQDIHSQGNFYPWHAGVLFLLETLLMDREPSIQGLPYFEWGAESDTRQSTIWGPTFLGGANGGPIPDGPFQDFAVGGTPVTRNFDAEPTFNTDNLLTIEAVIANEQELPFWIAEDTTDVSDQLELLHNILHLVVGGTMLEPDSPQDPVFYLHHAFVDKWWAKQWPAAGGFTPAGSPERMLEGLPLSRAYANLGGFTLQNSIDIQACVEYIETMKDAPVAAFVDAEGAPVVQEDDMSSAKLQTIADIQMEPVSQVEAAASAIVDSVDQAVAARDIPELNAAVQASEVPDAAPAVAAAIGVAQPAPL